jgi:hypothetical protein
VCSVLGENAIPSMCQGQRLPVLQAKWALLCWFVIDAAVLAATRMLIVLCWATGWPAGFCWGLLQVGFVETVLHCGAKQAARVSRHGLQS